MSVAIGTPPPGANLGRAGEGEVDGGGRDHPPEGRGGRQRGTAQGRQLPVVDFPPDFHPDDEEEDGHQAVVDDPFERAGELPLADLQAHRGLPERLYVVGEGRVCETEGHGRGDEQQHATGRLDGEEPIERAPGEAGEAQQGFPGLGWPVGAGWGVACGVGGRIGVHGATSSRIRAERSRERAVRSPHPVPR
jgi:hypothetical protein